MRCIISSELSLENELQHDCYVLKFHIIVTILKPDHWINDHNSYYNCAFQNNN